MKKRLMLILSCIFLGIGFIVGQTTKASGVVVDDTGEPVISASVVVKGTTVGVATDVDGKFSINVPTGRNTLVFTLVGMKTVEARAAEGMRVVMENDVHVLQQVEISVPYGTSKKASFTGAANVVNADVMKDMSAVSFEKGLQGASPGIMISSPSGQPGSQQSILLRGLGSINASNEPLYVIDGIPVVPENLSLTGVASSSGSLGVSSLVKPSDIESITILKDAAAAAIYGSRGANGVIIITTKSGKTGKTRVSLKASVGFNDWAVQSRKVLTGDQLRELQAESLHNYLVSADPSLTEEDIASITQEEVDADYPIPINGYSDWENALFKKRGAVQNYEITVDGGSDKTRFFASLGAIDETGKAKNSWVKQYTGRLNLTHEAGALKLGTNVSLSQIKKSTVAEGTAFANPYFATRNYLAPTVPIYNEDGTFYNGSLLNGRSNLLQSLDTDKYLMDMFNARASIWGEYTIYDKLKFKQTLSYDYSSRTATTIWSFLGSNGSNMNGNTIRIVPESRKIYTSSILSYSKSIDQHNFDFLVGWDVESNIMNYTHASGQNFPSDKITELIGAAIPTVAYSVKDIDRMLSGLSRLNYNYADKYYGSLSFRRDGSSRFGANKRWGTFWSASGAWRISGESFMSSLSFLDDLKIRASIGDTGNLPLSYYASLNTYKVDEKYMASSATYPARIPNPDLSWEKIRTWDIGLEARLFNRLSLEVDYYKRNSKDLIADVPVSQTTGFVQYIANMGKMTNQGIEASVAFDVVNTKDLFWNTKINLAHNTNKITEVYGGGTEFIRTPFITRKGYSYYSFYMREFAGINPETGAEQWYTNKTLEDGSLEKEITEDPRQAGRIIVGKGDPKLTGGWLNMINFKGIELSALVSFSIGGKFYDEGWTRDSNGYLDFSPSSMPSISQYENRWQKPGDTGVGKRSYAYSWGNYTSSKWLHSSTHARLKNVSLSYSLPSDITKKINFNTVRFIVSATNLITLKKTPDYDPEVPMDYKVGYSLPALKDVTFGIELNF